MKLLKYVLVMSLLAIVSFTLTAQDEESSLSGYYIVNASLGGDIIDNGDGTYEMTLLGVLPDIVWVISEPEPYMGGADLLLLSTEWVSNPDELTAHALLETGDVVLDVMLSAPNYDDFVEEMVVTMTVEDVYSNLEDVELEVPSFFESGALAIIIDEIFESGLATGAGVMLEEGRGSNTNRNNRATSASRSKSGRRGG